ncbi:MAG: hypothetical protein RR280_08630 [Bacteroidaceae bacterium]
MQTQALQPVPVKRNDIGLWTHPVFDQYWEEKFGGAEGCSDDEWKEVLRHFDVVTCVVDMEQDLPRDHEAYISYFTEGNVDISKWNPSTPAGEGWFLLSISMTEDGPTACWVRHHKKV